MVGLVALYHKGLCSTDQAKVIHRFVLREIGELVVWLLWLLLPFWQRVRAVEEDIDETSPLLWADDVAGRSNDSPDETRPAGASDGQERRWKWI